MSTLDPVDENCAIPNQSIGSPTKTIKKLTRVIQTEYGEVKVYINGDLEEKDRKAIFLTIHDIGKNHKVFQNFIDSPCMTEITARSIFVHIDLPGQEDYAEVYEESYPTIQQLGEILIVKVLDYLKLPLAVGLGEGAGANILVRFALKYPQRCLGLILIHLVSSEVGVLEKLKETFSVAKRRPSEVFQEIESLIAFHRFGKNDVDEFHSEIKTQVSSLNPLNLRKYVEVYMNRKDISEKLSQAKLDCLLIAGGQSPYASGVVQLFSKMDKSKTSLLKIDNVTNILIEAPEKLANSMLLFVKGLGYLTSLNNAGPEQKRMSITSQGSSDSSSSRALGAVGRRRTLSMEDYDTPKPRRLSLSTQQKNSIEKQ